MFYLITRLHKFECFNKMPKKSSWLVPTLIILLCTFSYLFLGLTIVVFMIHLAIFFMFGDILYIFLKKKNIKYWVIGIIVITITSGYLTYAWFNAKDIQRTTYSIDTIKDVAEIDMVFISDSHIGTTFNGTDFKSYIDAISEMIPDLIVIGGDFVDEKTIYEDMEYACKALGSAKTKYGVYMIFGNHDLNTYGGNRNYSTTEFIEILRDNNVNILEDEAILINEQFYLLGRKDRTVSDRMNIVDLTKNIDKSKPIIAIDHQPVDYQNVIKAGVDILLSGHTHGGQMFPLAYLNELVSQNEMTYGLKRIQDTTFIVSSGISGWGIPLKTGSISEYVYLKIK